MSIRLRLFLSFSIVLLLTGGVTLFGVRTIGEAGNLVVRLYDQPFMALSHARAAQAYFNDARVLMDHGLRLGEAASASDKKKLISTLNEINDELGIVAERMPSAAEEIANARKLANEWHQAGMQIIQPPPDGLANVPLPLNLRKKATEVEAALDRIVENASAFGFEFRSNAEATVVSSRTNLIALAIAAGFIGVLMSLWIAYSFSKPIKHAMQISERIATGDLTTDILTKRKDEFGRLLASLRETQGALRAKSEAQVTATETLEREHTEQIERRQAIEQHIATFQHAIGNMMRQIDEITNRMNHTARTLSMTATEADSQAKDAVSAAQQTSNNVATVATGTEELSSSVKTVTQRIEMAAEVVRKGTGIAHNTSEAIAGLAESAKRIDDIVNLIRAIAEQTNLLALNATIEAARAGEAGRGFAVVASEVKALATQTAKATEDISSQISGVQTSTNQTVDMIKTIATVMDEINELTTAISSAAYEQDSATTDIARTIHVAATATQDVARHVQGTTSSIEETSRAATEVLDAANDLTAQASALRASIDAFLSKVAA